MITTSQHPAFKTPIDNDVDGIQVNHNKLLADLVHSNNPLIDIAADHKLKLNQLIAWMAQPAVRALLDAADEAANRIAAHKAAQGRTAAVQTLLGQATGLCETPREHTLANSAARAVLRAASPAPTRKRKPAALLDATASPVIPPITQSAPIHGGPPPQIPEPNSSTLRFPVFPFRPEPNRPSASIQSTDRMGPTDARYERHENGISDNGKANSNGPTHPP